MPTTSKLDLALELWKSHGVLALGWIFCIPLAVYIALLHKRNNTIYKEYIAAIQVANAAVVPLLEKAVTVMAQVVSVIDGAADQVHERDKKIEELHNLFSGVKGQLDIVIQTFIGERYYTESAIDAGAAKGAIKSPVRKRGLRKPGQGGNSQ